MRITAIMIQFLFVIMMVQIHLMPATLSNSISPRLLSTQDQISDLDKTSGLDILNWGSTRNSKGDFDHIPTNSSGFIQFYSLKLHSEYIVPTVISSLPYQTDLTQNLAIQSNQTTNKSNDYYAMTPILGISRSITLSNSFASTVRSIAIVSLLTQSILYLIYEIYNEQNMIFESVISPNMVVNYFYPAWSIEFKYMTDQETQAYILYVAYPIAQILISVALWVVMIGIIKITMNAD